MDCRQALNWAILIISCSSLACKSENPVSEEGEWDGSMITSSYYALVNGTIIDGTGTTPIEQGILVIKGQEIIAVGTRDRIPVPREAQIVNVIGYTILPGIINAHVHDSFDESRLKTWAWNGVTTVRDEGMRSSPSMDELLAIRESARKKPECARLSSAGYMMTVPGGYGGLHVTSPDDAREKVLYQLSKGIDLIKLSQEDGYAGKHDLPKLSREEMDAIITTAHKQGTLVSAHITQSLYWAIVVEAGVDDVAHVAYDPVSDAVLDTMIKKNIMLVPTFTIFRNFNAPVDDCIENVRRFVQKGGAVALGNDYAGGPGEFDTGIPWYEFDCMLRAGMSRMQILVASTRNAARASHVDHLVGTLEVGKHADVLAVAGNPLQDLNSLKQIKLVIHGGVNIRAEK